MKKQLLIIPTVLVCAGSPLSLQASEKTLDLRIEARGNYRNSEESRFPTGLSTLTGNRDFDHDTVNSGEHVELSNITLFGKWQMSENWQTFAKIDVIDLYERNPTSGDKQVDVDNLYVRYGTRHTNGELPEASTYYVQFGKFGKFERQDDRHLESYGLISTAFNRLEDSGFELGFDHPSGFYAKVSYTSGNPFFFRDPNALAGDNGVKPDNVKKDIKNGMPILYDAEVESMNLSRNPETGEAIGYRWLNAGGDQRLNVMLFNYQRNMAKTIELNGTFYGGELDLLEVTGAEVPGLTTATLPIQGRSKDESGLNVWWYQGNLAIFAQYVTQKAAGLERDGEEVEVSYAFTGIPHIMAITPVFRYSKLRPDFTNGAQYPSPSVAWNWTKYDTGFNIDFIKALRLTMEYAQNDFIRQHKKEHDNEFLTTLRWRYDI